jgi:hypothetical protein
VRYVTCNSLVTPASHRLPNVPPPSRRLLSSMRSRLEAGATIVTGNNLLAAIDAAIYMLYDLTSAQIRHVESSIDETAPDDARLISGDEAFDLLESIADEALIGGAQK